LKCNTTGSISEGLIGGQEVEALAWGGVVAKDASVDLIGRQVGQVGFTGEVAAHAADGVFDAAFLPRFVSVAEERGEAEALGEQVMFGELGAVVEGEGLAQGRRKRLEEAEEALDDGLRGLVGLAAEAEMTRGALMEDQDGLAVFAEEHEIGFPMAGMGSVVGLRGAIVNRDAVPEVQHGTASAKSEAAAA
jgi:hypothetical protein